MARVEQKCSNDIIIIPLHSDSRSGDNPFKQKSQKRDSSQLWRYAVNKDIRGCKYTFDKKENGMIICNTRGDRE
jgi:hypothetical protein